MGAAGTTGVVGTTDAAREVHVGEDEACNRDAGGKEPSPRSAQHEVEDEEGRQACSSGGLTPFPAA